MIPDGQQWVYATGFAECATASALVLGPTCERSTSTPQRFISSITSRPKSDSPPSRDSQHPLPTRFWVL